MDNIIFIYRLFFCHNKFNSIIKEHNSVSSFLISLTSSLVGKESVEHFQLNSSQIFCAFRKPTNDRNWFGILRSRLFFKHETQQEKSKGEPEQDYIIFQKSFIHSKIFTYHPTMSYFILSTFKYSSKHNKILVFGNFMFW